MMLMQAYWWIMDSRDVYANERKEKLQKSSLNDYLNYCHVGMAVRA
jgi:hypothetical protein